MVIDLTSKEHPCKSDPLLCIDMFLTNFTWVNIYHRNKTKISTALLYPIMTCLTDQDIVDYVTCFVACHRCWNLPTGCLNDQETHQFQASFDDTHSSALHLVDLLMA